MDFFLGFRMVLFTTGCSQHYFYSTSHHCLLKLKHLNQYETELRSSDSAPTGRSACFSSTN